MCGLHIMRCDWCLGNRQIDSWIMSNDLHYMLWQSIHDGESYVRASVVSALTSLHSNDVLWTDFTHRYITQA